MTLRKSSPCKINLLLNILGRRPDGFHELETLLQPVPLHDVLTFEKGGSGFALSCSHPGLDTGPDNLISRAARQFFEATGIGEGVRVHLDKQIPMEAGLGGGSGNAATTLLGLNELFGQPLEANALESMAAALGSDVPFFLHNQPALAVGRGEEVTPLEPFAALRGCSLLLLHPGFGIPTGWAYQSLARFPGALQGRPGRARELTGLLEGQDLERVGGALYNTLEAPAFAKYPYLELLKQFLQEKGARASLMSGSGSTLFALLPSHEEAEGLLAQAKEKFHPPWSALVDLP